MRQSVWLLFLYGALDSHAFFPSHVASGCCFPSAAAAGAPAGVVSAFAEPPSPPQSGACTKLCLPTCAARGLTWKALKTSPNLTQTKRRGHHKTLHTFGDEVLWNASPSPTLHLILHNCTGMPFGAGFFGGFWRFGCKAKAVMQLGMSVGPVLWRHIAINNCEVELALKNTAHRQRWLIQRALRHPRQNMSAHRNIIFDSPLQELRSGKRWQYRFVVLR